MIFKNKKKIEVGDTVKIKIKDIPSFNAAVVSLNADTIKVKVGYSSLILDLNSITVRPAKNKTVLRKEVC